MAIETFFVWHGARLVEKEKAFAQEIWFISDIPVYARLCVWHDAA